MGKFLGIVDFRRFGRFLRNLAKGAHKDIQRIIREVGLSDVAKDQLRGWVKEYLVKRAFGASSDIFNKLAKILIDAKSEIADKQMLLNEFFDKLEKPSEISEDKWNEITSELKSKMNSFINLDLKRPVEIYSDKLNAVKNEVDKDIEEAEAQINDWISELGK